MHLCKLLIGGLASASTSLAAALPPPVNTTPAVNTTTTTNIANNTTTTTTANPTIDLAALAPDIESLIFKLCPEEQDPASQCLDGTRITDSKAIDKCFDHHRWMCVRWREKADFCAEKGVFYVHIRGYARGKLIRRGLWSYWTGKGEWSWKREGEGNETESGHEVGEEGEMEGGLQLDEPVQALVWKLQGLSEEEQLRVVAHMSKVLDDELEVDGT